MSNHNILPWAMTTKTNIQLLGWCWWCRCFLRMLCWLGYGTWSCLIATDRSCRVESNRAGRGRVTFSFQILQYCIAEREHGASNGRSNSVKRQHLQRLWPLPSLPPLWSQEPHSGSWSPMVTREAELCVVGTWCVSMQLVNVRHRQRHSTTLVKCDNQSEKLLLPLLQVLNTI